MKKPWEADLLSLTNAVRLIIALTKPDGERLAELITDLSSVGRLTLSRLGDAAARAKFGDQSKIPPDYKNDYDRAYKAIRPAQERFEDWLESGQLSVSGVSKAGVMRLDKHECAHRTANYVTNALEGEGVETIRLILIDAADVKRLCKGSLSDAEVGASANLSSASSPTIAEIESALEKHVATWPKDKPYPGAERCWHLIEDVLRRHIKREVFQPIYRKKISDAGKRGRRRNPQK